MTHPDVPCTVVGEGIDDSVRYGCYGNKSVGLEKDNPALRPDPHCPVRVLKEGMRLVGQPAVFAIHLDLAVHPSIQPGRCAHPKTAIPRDRNGRNSSARQTLLDGNRRDGEVAKPIEAIVGRHPNVAFPIFKESGNGSVRQAFGWGKQISSSLVDMQQPLVHQGADPHATIVIPQQPVGLESSGKRVRLEFSVPQLCDSVVLGNQESAVIAFEQRVDSLRRIRHGIERG